MEQGDAEIDRLTSLLISYKAMARAMGFLVGDDYFEFSHSVCQVSTIQSPAARPKVGKKTAKLALTGNIWLVASCILIPSYISANKSPGRESQLLRIFEVSIFGFLIYSRFLQLINMVWMIKLYVKPLVLHGYLSRHRGIYSL